VVVKIFLIIFMLLWAQIILKLPCLKTFTYSDFMQKSVNQVHFDASVAWCNIRIGKKDIGIAVVTLTTEFYRRTIRIGGQCDSHDRL
jgi:hypothetical protein